LFSVIITNLSAQNPISIKSPLPDSTVHNGEIFIVCSVDPRIKFIPESVKIFIEGAEISPLIKINANIITILVLNEIRPDIYTAEIQLRSESGKLYRKSWSFFVDIYKSEDISRQVLKSKQNQEKLSFKGSSDVSLRFTSIDGSGTFLRSEPRQLHDIRINGAFRYHHFKIPIKLYLSNQENVLQPYKNRFMTGYESDYLKIYGGDINVDYHAIALNGTSVRGLKVDFKFRSTEYSFITGYINRAIEGAKEKFMEGSGFPPANMLADSSYIVEGVYRRKISAFNAVFNAIDGTKFNIMFLKSTDDSSSIKFGGMAAQNFVFGAGNQVKFNNDRVAANINVALSATTFDIRRGVYSKYQIDEIYGSDIPFFPEQYKWLLIFNGTTVPLIWKNKPSLALWGDARINILKQKFIFRYQRYGSSFYSFGNPFLVNNRRIMSAEDRIDLFNRKIRLRLNYTFSTNNLSFNLLNKKFTHIYSGILNLKIKPNFPGFDVSYRLYNRIEKEAETNVQVFSTIVHNFNTGLNVNFKTGKFEHILQASYNLFLRQTIDANTASHSVNFYFNENMNQKLLLTLYSNSFVMTHDSSNLGIINTLGGRLLWKFLKGKVQISGGVNYTINEESGLISLSKRFNSDMDFGVFVIKNMVLKITLGKGMYTEPELSMMNYKEMYALFKLNYLF